MQGESEGDPGSDTEKNAGGIQKNAEWIEVEICQQKRILVLAFQKAA